jgi:archaellum component FlaD/FlaE
MINKKKCKFLQEDLGTLSDHLIQLLHIKILKMERMNKVYFRKVELIKSNKINQINLMNIQI